MTEQEIERTAERRMNMLDRALLRGDLTQEGYDRLVLDLDAWANLEYEKQYGMKRRSNG